MPAADGHSALLDERAARIPLLRGRIRAQDVRSEAGGAVLAPLTCVLCPRLVQQIDFFLLQIDTNN